MEQWLELLYSLNQQKLASNLSIFAMYNAKMAIDNNACEDHPIDNMKAKFLQRFKFGFKDVV